MVTNEDEDEKRHATERLSTGSNTGRGSGWTLRRGVSWGVITCPRLGRDKGRSKGCCQIRRTGDPAHLALQNIGSIFGKSVRAGDGGGGGQLRLFRGVQIEDVCITRSDEGLFICSQWFSETVLGAGKSWSRREGEAGDSMEQEGRKGGMRKGLILVSSLRLAVRSQLSSSSALCWSSSLTCVKGKWPRLPLHSPSHWPFTFILVTITISPT